MEYTYVVHYAEIGLKGRNRPDFEHRLMKNIQDQHPGTELDRLRGRIRVRSREKLDLSNVFGIAWWAEARVVPSRYEEIAEGAVSILEGAGLQPRSFAVRATRADKVLSMNSQEIERRLGARLQQVFGWPVDLTSPELTLHVEVTREQTFLYTERNPGPRGLPVGISGKLMGLFSGGIDSAVAAYLMAKRGAQVELVHFYALSDPTQLAQEKVGRLAARLRHFLPRLVIHYLPYHRFQLATTGLPRRLQKQELVVFRRFMMRSAQELARERSAQGLFTGDSLVQVASQTLENLAAVAQVLDLPLFQPLIAFDKQEIMDLGKEIGVFEIAAEAYKDCCSIIARHPATVAKEEQIAEIEEAIDVMGLVERTLAERTTQEVAVPAEAEFLGASPRP